MLGLRLREEISGDREERPTHTPSVRAVTVSHRSAGEEESSHAGVKAEVLMNTMDWTF